VTLGHLGFLGFTVWMAHYPVLFIGGFLFFIAFMQATAQHQTKLDLRGPMSVGFFLAGLVVQRRIARLVDRAGAQESRRGAGVFRRDGADCFQRQRGNHLISRRWCRASPTEWKYAVVAGAVTGGGLTVIANAPNPAGQTLLKRRYFQREFHRRALLWVRCCHTFVMGLCFMLL